jgi:hypothetical protein
MVDSEFVAAGMRHDCHDGLRRASRQSLMIHYPKEETELLAPSPVRDGLRCADAAMQSVAFARALPPKEKK